MAAVEVSISSRCTIKPSSATPPHLRTWKLSMLDQMFPNLHFPFILFYLPSPSHPPAAILACLKLSLSHALTKYYPLAGRYDELTSTIDCGDQGIDFFEAQATGQLLQKPGPDLLRQLAPPAGGGTTGYLRGVLLAVQATVFNCGGVSLGLCISHKIVDGVSLISFLHSWAASVTTRGGDVVLESCYFPRMEFPLPELELDDRTERTVQHRFVLDGPQLTALRSANGLVGAIDFPTPTRVEEITGLFWSAIIRARADLGPAGKGLALHMVNLRKHMAEPAAKTLLGNFAFPVVLTEEEGDDKSWRRLGLKLGNAVRQEMNYEKLQVARGPGRLSFIVKSYVEMERLPLRCPFSSWCHFPVYEVDFGWGKPAWAAFGGSPMKEAVFILDRKDSEGVEVWVNLEQEEMERLLRDQELLSYVSAFPAESLYNLGGFKLCKL